MCFPKNRIYTNFLTCFVWFSVILSSQNVTVFSNLANLTECDCGWRNSIVSTNLVLIYYECPLFCIFKGLQIVGGNETGINEFPAMAALINLETGTLYCGAQIISDRYVLTAAHCVYNKDVADLVLLVGEHNISTGKYILR